MNNMANQEKLEKINEVMMNMRDSYKEKFAKFINDTLGGTWTVVSLYEDNMTIGFITGYWDAEKTNPKYQSFDLYFGNRSWVSKNDWQYQINTCCFGSFDIIGENIPKTYYIGVSKLLSDSNFNSILEHELRVFKAEISNYKDEYNKIYNVIQKEKEEKARKEEEIKNKKIYNDQLEMIATNEYPYAVIIKNANNENNFIYRKKNVRLVEMFKSYNEAIIEMNKQQRYSYFKYAIVDTCKLKIAA